jgi:methanogenic corrinoid protein MtbC1
MEGLEPGLEPAGMLRQDIEVRPGHCKGDIHDIGKDIVCNTA